MPDTLPDAPYLPAPQALAAFCRKHHIRRLALFGSRLTGAARPDSDVDLLVEFEEGHVPGYLRLSGMQNELTGMVGLSVDLRLPEELSRFFRDEVTAQSRLLYAS